MHAERANRSRGMLRRVRTIAVVAVLLGVAAPVAAQAEVQLTGLLLDLDGTPVPDYRVVYREAATFQVHLSAPSDSDGRFAATVPAGGIYTAVAVLSPQGGRIELEDQPELQGVAGSTQEIRLFDRVASGPVIERFPGGDRLYLSFIEDTALTARLRLEAQVDVEDFEGAEITAARGIVAYQFPALAGVEIGGRFGFGDRDFGSTGPGGSGATDTDVWVKMSVSSDTLRAPDLAVGAIISLPTGDSDKGLGFDSLASKLFFSARQSFRYFDLTGHFGIRANQNGEIVGFSLDGKTAAEAGVALLWPALQRLTVILEGSYRGRRFEGFDDDSRLLLGLNWKPFAVGSFRFAASTGIGDGAPDSQFIGGYSFDF